MLISTYAHLMKIILIIVLAFYLSTQITFAHPGRTASDGCHYCRTRCDYWGVPSNQRHCHGGSSAPSYKTTSQPKIPTCPPNSYYSSVYKKCTCHYGYSSSLNKKSCVKIPVNAHAVNSATDVWLCDEGYEEISNMCKLVEKEVVKEVVVEINNETKKEAIVAGINDEVEKISITKSLTASSINSLDNNKSLSTELKSDIPRSSDDSGVFWYLIVAISGGYYIYSNFKKTKQK